MNRPAKIRGLCFDVPKNTGYINNIMEEIGICQETSIPADDGEALKPPPLPIHADGPTIPSESFCFYLRRIKSSAALSVASINDVAAIYVRKRALIVKEGTLYRCYGLYIVHHDSNVEVLGRWDPRDEKCISKLYDESQGSLMRLKFHLKPIARMYIVDNITVEVTDNPCDFWPRNDSTLVSNDPYDHDVFEKPRAGYEHLETSTFDCTQSNQVRVSCLPLSITLVLMICSKAGCVVVHARI